MPVVLRKEGAKGPFEIILGIDGDGVSGEVV